MVNRRDMNRSFTLYARHRFDISVRDILFGFRALVTARRSGEMEDHILRSCSLEDGLVCYSVRSGFDLLLGALGLPAGSEVIVSAITHPDMVRIIEHHWLRAVPVDLDPETLEPREEDLERALSSRTRAILAAHLFGGRMDLTGVSGFARRHGILLFEDCAQAFQGPREMGSPLSDVSMFSFGPIKTATALGGAIFRVRDPLVREKMRKAQASWPVRRRRAFAARLLKMLCLDLITRPVPYRLFARSCELLGWDLDTLASGAARAFPAGAKPGEGELASRIRHRPSAPLLALLLRRLETFDGKRLNRRALIGEEAARLLPERVVHPGRRALSRTHWLFPIVVPYPERLVRSLGDAGFDASRATSNIAAVSAPTDRPDLAPERAAGMMSGAVFLPVYPELPRSELRRLIRIVEEATRDES